MVCATLIYWFCYGERAMAGVTHVVHVMGREKTEQEKRKKSVIANFLRLSPYAKYRSSCASYVDYVCMDIAVAISILSGICPKSSRFATEAIDGPIVQVDPARQPTLRSSPNTAVVFLPPALLLVR